MVKRFLKAGRSGFYFSVAREGELAPGDPIQLLAEDEHRISVADIVRLLGPDRKNADLLRRASELLALPEPLREHFRNQLAKGWILSPTQDRQQAPPRPSSSLRNPPFPPRTCPPSLPAHAGAARIKWTR